MKTVSFRELVSLWECCFPCNEAGLLFRPRGEGQGAGPAEGGGDRCGNPAERPGAARCPSRPVELAGTRAHARCGDAETARGNAWPLPASRAGGRGAAWHGTRAGARWQQAGKSSGGPRAGPAGRATVTASVRTPATAGLARGGRSRRSAQQPGRAATWGTPPAPRPESPAARGALAEPDGRRGKQLGGRLPPGVGVRRGRGAAARGDGAGAGGGPGDAARQEGDVEVPARRGRARRLLCGVPSADVLLLRAACAVRARRPRAAGSAPPGHGRPPRGPAGGSGRRGSPGPPAAGVRGARRGARSGEPGRPGARTDRDRAPRSAPSPPPLREGRRARAPCVRCEPRCRGPAGRPARAGARLIARWPRRRRCPASPCRRRPRTAWPRRPSRPRAPCAT